MAPSGVRRKSRHHPDAAADGVRIIFIALPIADHTNSVLSWRAFVAKVAAILDAILDERSSLGS
jgi:hypothetical protein